MKKGKQQLDMANNISHQLPIPQRRLMDCAGDSGVSSWLSALPIEEHHFSLSKGTFRDALCLRYGWNITNVSSKCACGANFDIDHAMSCHKGGLPTLRHNEVWDITAEMIKEVCKNVEIEPRLQPRDRKNLQLRTANHEEEARLNLKATGGLVWRMGFYPSASSCRSKELVTLCRAHEAAKKREYGERVREVERGVFTPLVFSSTGGMACECTTFFKRLADLLSVKKQLPYSQVLCWIWWGYRLHFWGVPSWLFEVHGLWSPPPIPMTFSVHAQKRPCVIMYNLQYYINKVLLL